MIKEFIPYEQALKLKELGFDEECIQFWYPSGAMNNSIPSYGFQNWYKTNGYLNAPLWQQAFDWFTSLGYHSYIEGAYPWFRYYINSEDNRWEGYKHLKIEEARIECLKKLIEIVKMNNNHG